MAEIKAWWKALSQREQHLLLGAGSALMIAILYWGIWQPLNQRAIDAQNKINQQRQLLNWVEHKANQITALKRAGGTVNVSDEGLNQVINETTTRFKIDLIRMQPRNDALQVWVQPLPFDTLVNWLVYLQQSFGINTQFIDLSKTDKNGMVEVNRLQLGRG
ncbi:type II secretion system protein M [Photobacterium carnosum]|uniref:type II secretion system protein M n=1 Tax=Photobacterium carnosum TaxID=2023717 RepID=UPI001C90887E|nr:type II secretion system protein M [Photobacterium carnosum]MBY3789264.1 type II secretion system protein M [Photobacterium carnosum]MCD9515713.1 type II secretion system protein M [Photobacterium carnosum]MCD9534322.1 type II secretion system protein M [Photobacterium carnosum]MCD9549952.1 type II secretion system protein M [Photobacterium carnosum]MCF2307021.1 type II secretion system protein M [Photobacterium carnosum]